MRFLIGGAVIGVAAIVYSFDSNGMDTTVSPTADFFKFANGGWYEKTVIPPDKARVGTFDDLQERNSAILHEAVEDAANDPKLDPNTTRGKVGLFYRVGMDEAKANALGAKPIEGVLKDIDDVNDGASLAKEVARLHRMGIGAAFRMSVEQDQKDSMQTIMGIRQGGLGLQGRESYLGTSSRSAGIRGKYVDVMEKSFELVGEPADQAKTDSEGVMAFETELAKSMSTPVQLRDIDKNYNKGDLKYLDGMGPGFDWDVYFAELGRADPGPLDVGQPAFIRALDQSVQTTPMPVWRAYLKHLVINQASPYLSSDFEDNQFRMASVTRGVSQEPERWQRVLGATSGALGEALGQLYVEKVFPPEAKERALQMVKNLKAVLRSRIQELDWMEPATKTQAIKKLDAMAINVGYPDHWRDYSKLEVRDDSFLANVYRSQEYNFTRMLSRLGKSPDRKEWRMTPQTVNATYSPNRNDITFPAGILQPPFFDPKAPDASNYGGIGAVIGHEMTHGFDDDGRKYDGKGNLRDWWTPEDTKRFTARAEALAAQYDNYVVNDETNVDGHLTLGENIADLGGLKIAYLAFHKATNRKQEPTVNGFTPDQQFFLSFGQIWREKMRPESARQLALSDPHSPPMYRVKGVLQNTPEFWKAFGATPPGNTISIW